MLTAALVSCASCSTSEPAEISDGGPMIVNVGSGGFAFAEPKHRGLWTGTFGAFRLCNKAPGVESRVLKVIPDVSSKPARACSLVTNGGTRREARQLR